MSSSAFIESLKLAVTEPRSRLALLCVLAEFGGEVVYVPRLSKAQRRRSVAAQMIASGTSAADVATALCERYPISQRTAQRDICIAAKTSKNFVANSN